jgi:hypothetical protein
LKRILSDTDRSVYSSAQSTVSISTDARAAEIESASHGSSNPHTGPPLPTASPPWPSQVMPPRRGPEFKRFTARRAIRSPYRQRRRRAVRADVRGRADLFVALSSVSQMRHDQAATTATARRFCQNCLEISGLLIVNVREHKIRAYRAMTALPLEGNIHDFTKNDDGIGNRPAYRVSACDGCAGTRWRRSRWHWRRRPQGPFRRRSHRWLGRKSHGRFWPRSLWLWKGQPDSNSRWFPSAFATVEPGCRPDSSPRGPKSR